MFMFYSPNKLIQHSTWLQKCSIKRRGKIKYDDKKKTKITRRNVEKSSTLYKILVCTLKKRKGKKYKVQFHALCVTREVPSPNLQYKQQNWEKLHNFYSQFPTFPL